jgi:hypothetical protein
MNEPIRERVRPEPVPVDLSDDLRLVTVCSACLCASCWLGEFGCQEYKTASTKQMTVAELRALDREHSDYWKPERAYG